MAMCGTIVAIFAVFVVIRLKARGDAAPAEREAFQTISAQVVYPGDFANPDAIGNERAGTSEGIN
jgi:hypothetical protein